jgi:beta-mannosidase
MIPQSLPLQWRLGWTDDPSANPTEWIAGSAPGSVQTDWANAHGWPDPSWDNDLAKYRWMEDKHWVYEADYQAEAPPCLQIFGVDHSARVTAPLAEGGTRTWFVHGLHNHQQIADLAPRGTIRIVINPAPKHKDWTGLMEQRHHEARNSTKPPVSYGWDFHPRFVPLGLWQTPRLLSRPPQEIRTEASLSEDLNAAQVVVRAEGSWDVVLVGPSAAVAARGRVEDGAPLRLTVEGPELWWPHTHGPQSRYRLELVNDAGERETRLVAFRRIRLVPHEGSWTSTGVPSGPNNPPITLEVNGQMIFALGTNLVNMDLAPGRVDRERVVSILGLAKEAGFNLLRNWGGAAAPTEEFFEICSELGLLVWQEFPLACTRYDEQPYIDQLKREAEEMVRRLRCHPCLAILCGGNELFNSWSLMTEQDIALRTLDSVCLAEAPETPFLKTSPIMGMGHGSYLFVIHDGRDVMEYITDASCTAYTEFGVPSLSSMEALDRMIPQYERWPIRDTMSWRERHGLKAWDGHPASWSTQDIVEDILGPMGSLEELIAGAQLLQGEGLRFIYEEARRQKPKASMALNWCFNEPWPTAANNSLLQWPDNPKPAYFAVKEACRPTLASLRFFHSRFLPGEEMRIEPWLLNESPEAQQAEVSVRVNGEEIGVARLEAGAWRNGKGESLLAGAAFVNCVMTLEAVCEEHPEWNSKYTLFMDRRGERETPPDVR